MSWEFLGASNGAATDAIQFSVQVCEAATAVLFFYSNYF
jgi:hypothetical protein